MLDARQHVAACGGALIGDQVDMAELAAHLEELLRGSHVHNGQTVKRPTAVGVGGLQDADDAHGLGALTDA